MVTSPFSLAAPSLVERGWAVFPILPRGKAPITTNGFKDATTDLQRIGEWQNRFPNANIGIATGHASGFFVVDVDISDAKRGLESLAELERIHGSLPVTLTARTGSGGRHLFFTVPKGVLIRNTVGALGDGIDTRGTGGYIVAPPSVHPSGGVYEWLNDAPIADPPTWLVEKLTAKTCHESGRRANDDNNGPDDPALGELATIEPPRKPGPNGNRDRYVVAALEREVAKVAHAKQGTRNATLNRAAFSIGRYVGGGAISESQVVAELTRAALACGLGDDEIANTIKSGLAGGKVEPRRVPERSMRASLSNAYANQGGGLNESGGEELAGLPEVVVNGRPMRDVSRDALGALELDNVPPHIFVRSGELTAVVPDEKGNPRMSPVSEAALRGRLCRAADFVRNAKTRGGDLERFHTDPPISIVRDILALGNWPLPPLTGVIEAPALRPDGTIIFRAGYDEATGLFHHSAPGLCVPPVEDRPSPLQVSAATKLLLEPLVDFPFDSDASRANALALMLTPMYRPAISGNTPLTLIDAPQSGSGKSLLARVANVLYAGNPDPSIITAPRDEDEWRKRITSALLAGAPIITIDNLTGTLSSGTLCAALTTGTWSDRALGGNTIVRLPQRATWIATGNNVTLAGDMPRRCCWVRLDPKVSRPYQRDGFKHDDLIGWVIGHRGELIAAALTLARAWVSAGRPSGTAPRMGSFEDWAYVLGGVLAVAGVPGFLGNSAEMLEGADEDAPQWEAFLIELAEEMGGGAATFAEIWDTIRSSPRLIDLIPATFDTPFTTDSSGNGVLSAKFRKELVYAFRTRKGTRFGDSQARIERVAAEAGRSKTARWRIFGMPIPAKSAGDAGDAGDVSAQMCGEDQGIDTEGRMGADLDGPPHPPHPSLVLSPELQAIASLPDERARLEAWGEAKGLEVTYLSEAGDRLRMARNTAS